MSAFPVGLLSEIVSEGRHAVRDMTWVHLSDSVLYATFLKCFKELTVFDSVL